MARIGRAFAIPARLASQSAAIFGMRLFGAAIVFATQAAMAKLLGPQFLGQYMLVVAAVNLLAAFMPLGFQVIGTYVAADYRAQNETGLLIAFARRAYGHVAVTAVLAFGLITLIASHGTTTAFALVGEVGHAATVMAAATAVVFVNGALLVGMKHPFAGFAADTLLRPLVMAAGTLVAVLAVSRPAQLNVMMWCAACAYGSVALVQARFTWRAMRSVPMQPTAAPAPTGRWWRFALPWAVIAMATDSFFDIDLLLLAPLMSIEDLAVFGVCTRVLSLVAFGIGAVYAVTLPDLLDAQTRQDAGGLRRKLTDANLIATAFAAAASVGMLFSGPILALFGPAFVAGATPLAVLCVGLTIRAVMGPAAFVLSLHDKPHASLPAIAVGLAVLAGANSILVPAIGLTGAATSASFAIAVWAVTQWWIALRQTGIDVSIWPRLREMLRPARPLSA